MPIAYNKNTREWLVTVKPEDLDDRYWILNPTFADEAFANEIGNEYWTFEGNIIKTPTREAYNALVLEKARAKRWADIQAERDMRRTSGVKVGNYWFHSDEPSRIQYLGLVIAGAGLPAGLMWKTMSGVFVEMTPALAQQVFMTSIQAEQTIFVIAETHKAQMMASAKPGNYDFMNGSPAWPPYFGEQK